MHAVLEMGGWIHAVLLLEIGGWMYVVLEMGLLNFCVCWK